MAARPDEWGGPPASPLQVSEVRAGRAHRLHRVKMLEPAICRVNAGIKRVFMGGQQMAIGPGEWLLLPAQLAVDIENEPDSQGYFAQVLGFPRQLLAEFQLAHAGHFPPQPGQRQLAHWRIRPDARLDTAWQRLIRSCAEGEAALLQRHLLHEVFLILGLRGLLWPLLSHAESSLAERLQVFLMAAPPGEWTQEKAAAYFHVSVATLRRHLAAEGRSFRAILDECRMLRALNQLQSTRQAIDTIADACGYASTARFSSRFRAHFGLSPHALRKALVSPAPMRRPS